MTSRNKLRENKSVWIAEALYIFKNIPLQGQLYFVNLMHLECLLSLTFLSGVRIFNGFVIISWSYTTPQAEPLFVFLNKEE